MIMVKHPQTNQEFELRAGLIASPKKSFDERSALQVQILSVNERDMNLSCQELASPNYKGFPRKHKFAIDEFSEKYTPEEYAF